MTQYQYEMTWYPEGNEMTMKTNDSRLLLDTLQGVTNMGDHVEVIDGFTGEVLCVMNHPNAYKQEAFGLMVLGRQMEKLMG